MEDFKHTKNQFKQRIKNLNIQALTLELKDINLDIMKANNESSKGVNPYHKGVRPVKLLKWKRANIMVEIKKKSLR